MYYSKHDVLPLRVYNSIYLMFRGILDCLMFDFSMKDLKLKGYKCSYFSFELDISKVMKEEEKINIFEEEKKK